MHERSRLGYPGSLCSAGLRRDRVSHAGATRSDRLTHCQARGGGNHSRRRLLPGQRSDGDQATVTASVSQGWIVSPELGSSRSHLTVFTSGCEGHVERCPPADVADPDQIRVTLGNDHALDERLSCVSCGCAPHELRVPATAGPTPRGACQARSAASSDSSAAPAAMTAAQSPSVGPPGSTMTALCRIGGAS